MGLMPLGWLFTFVSYPTPNLVPHPKGNKMISMSGKLAIFRQLALLRCIYAFLLPGQLINVLFNHVE
jgi:hypothetical protein